jgi:hypothetical protein
MNRSISNSLDELIIHMPRAWISIFMVPIPIIKMLKQVMDILFHPVANPMQACPVGQG